MRAFRYLNVAILSAVVAGSAALYAQDEKPQEEPKRQDEARPEPKREEPKRDEMKAPRQDEAKPSKQEKQEQRQQDEKQSHEQMKAGEHQHGQPAGKTARIPDDKFRTHFGRSHTFVVNRPVMVGGQPQFQYGGYSFVIIDAWPAEWAYTDDCYIDDIDGEYFLFDLLHPGVRIALMVVL